MNCPSCEDGLLRPVWLEPQLPCYRCGDCCGVLLPLIAYRAWLENSPEVDTHQDAASVISDETSRAMTCTRCNGMMTKYRFTADLDRRLDLCSRCEDVWLDAGEWAFLKERQLQGELTSVFTESWQRDLLRERQRQWSSRHWRERLGEQADEAKQFKDWLERQPNRRDIIAYLAERET